MKSANCHVPLKGVSRAFEEIPVLVCLCGSGGVERRIRRNGVLGSEYQ
jgi:hypothetical protein